MMSRSKTHVPDRSIAQPGRRRKALDKNARRPRDWDVTIEEELGMGMRYLVPGNHADLRRRCQAAILCQPVAGI